MIYILNYILLRYNSTNLYKINALLILPIYFQYIKNKVVLKHLSVIIKTKALLAFYIKVQTTNYHFIFPKI